MPLGRHVTLGAEGLRAASLVMEPRGSSAERRGGSKSESNFFRHFDSFSIVSIRELIGIFLEMILGFVMMLLPLFR